MVEIRTKKRKPKKGFCPDHQKLYRQGWRNVAIELNQEQWDKTDGFPDLRDSEIIDVLEIHHLAIAPVNSRKDQALIQHWSECISEVYISAPELLAEVYVTTVNDHALAIGANVGRIYHNSYLGDTRLRPNSIGHIFEPCTTGELPAQVIQILKKYVVVERIADGKKVTLRNRLGV